MSGSKLQAKLFDIPTYKIPTKVRNFATKYILFFYKKRVEYTARKLESIESKHTLSNCDACYKQQKSFPSKPLYTTPVCIICLVTITITHFFSLSRTSVYNTSIIYIINRLTTNC